MNFAKTYILLLLLACVTALNSMEKEQSNQTQTKSDWNEFIASVLAKKVLDRAKQRELDKKLLSEIKNYIGVIEPIQGLLRDGANPNARDVVTDQTPLLAALELANPAIVSTLLEAGADPIRTIGGSNPLSVAINMRKTPARNQIIRLFLTYYGEPISSRDLATQDLVNTEITNNLERASLLGDVVAINRILEANPNAAQETNALLFAVATRNSPILSALINHSSDEDIRQADSVLHTLVRRLPNSIAEYTILHNILLSRLSTMVQSTATSSPSGLLAEAGSGSSFPIPASAIIEPKNLPKNQETFGQALRDIQSGKKSEAKNPEVKPQQRSWKKPIGIGAFVASLVAGGATAGHYIKDYLYPEKKEAQA